MQFLCHIFMIFLCNKYANFLMQFLCQKLYAIFMPKIICNIHTNYAMQYICHDNNAIFIPQNICNYYASLKPDCLGLLQVISIHKYPQRHELKRLIIRAYIHFKQR